MSIVKSILESLLFISDRPLSKKELAKITERGEDEVEENLNNLIKEYNQRDGGVKVLRQGDQFQMVTNPENAEFIQKFLKEEITGELTPASLETLSIISYRGSIRREELEQIRGVNCAIILRNLTIRGLIETEEKDGQIFYRVSLDFIRQLGITDLKELPDYQRLHQLPIEYPDQGLANSQSTN